LLYVKAQDDDNHVQVYYKPIQNDYSLEKFVVYDYFKRLLMKIDDSSTKEYRFCVDVNYF
jgi:hypothetical protein